MTENQITAMRIRAECWSDANPFQKSLLARLGGLHRAPQASDDRHIMAEEEAVALLRDLPAAKSEPSSEF